MMLELNKIHQGDCLELMKRIPDNYFDLIITDPPYGINVGGSKPFGKVNVGGEKLCKVKDYIGFDDSTIPTKEIFKEMFRISKNQIIFGGNYFIEYLHNTSCWIVWDKDNSGNFADCELAWTSFNTAVRKFKYRWNGMLQERMNWKEERFHPTQKPIELGRWLLKKYAKKGFKICDPFSGSGTFSIASKQSGYDFMGFEISEHYVKIANERLSKLDSRLQGFTINNKKLGEFN